MVNWSDKIRAAISLGTSKGLRIDSNGSMMANSWRITHPDNTRIRIAGASKLISYLESYETK